VGREWQVESVYRGNRGGNCRCLTYNCITVKAKFTYLRDPQMMRRSERLVPGQSGGIYLPLKLRHNISETH